VLVTVVCPNTGMHNTANVIKTKTNFSLIDIPPCWDWGRDSLIGLNFIIWKSQEFLQAPDMID
jgi:hypothetical protein